MNKIEKIDSRKFMRLAIEMMRQSVAEPRDDSKTSPMVGVVLVKPDGTVETACRGELRHGDHAEFTILERKNRSNKLDGSILFTTLEPCAPSARRPPKLGCAERIAAARIKTVWIGIEDPDPTVAGEGIQYLISKGVEIKMFDRELQGIIEKENNDFLAQARDRAKEAEREPAKPPLSSFKNRPASVILEDFSDEALSLYHERAKITEAIGSDEFNRRLLQQGLLKEEDEHFVPTGFGILLFGKEPRRIFQQAGLLGSFDSPYGNEREEFDQPAVLIPDLVEKWLKAKLPYILDRSRMKREERPVLPFEIVREAVVNALIHRDYSIEGGKCQLIVTDETVMVMSPGLPPAPITLEQLQSFSAPMLSRNPVMHYVFAQMGMAEEQGFGIKSLQKQAQSNGLPLPRYTWNDPYLVLTIYQSVEAAARALNESVLASMSKSEQQGWQWLSTKQKISAQEYAIAMRIPRRTALNHLKQFTQLGLLRAVGSGPLTRYEVVS